LPPAKSKAALTRPIGVAIIRSIEIWVLRAGVAQW
jgi:hypothetical protein